MIRINAGFHSQSIPSWDPYVYFHHRQQLCNFFLFFWGDILVLSVSNKTLKTRYKLYDFERYVTYCYQSCRKSPFAFELIFTFNFFFFNLYFSCMFRFRRVSQLLLQKLRLLGVCPVIPCGVCDLSSTVFQLDLHFRNVFRPERVWGSLGGRWLPRTVRSSILVRARRNSQIATKMLMIHIVHFYHFFFIFLFSLYI